MKILLVLSTDCILTANNEKECGRVANLKIDNWAWLSLLHYVCSVL